MDAYQKLALLVWENYRQVVTEHIFQTRPLFQRLMEGRGAVSYVVENIPWTENPNAESNVELADSFVTAPILESNFEVFNT